MGLLIMGLLIMGPFITALFIMWLLSTLMSTIFFETNLNFARKKYAFWCFWLPETVNQGAINLWWVKIEVNGVNIVESECYYVDLWPWVFHPPSNKIPIFGSESEKFHSRDTSGLFRVQYFYFFFRKISSFFQFHSGWQNRVWWNFEKKS